MALSPIALPQQPSELGLIFRALVELRNDISELKERLQPAGEVMPLGLPSGEFSSHVMNGELNLRHHEESLYRKLKEFEEEKKSS